MAGVVSKAVANNTTVPMLAGIRVEAKDGEVEMQATDLNVSIRHKATAHVEEEGVVVVSGKILQGIVKNLPDAAVNFDMKEGSTVLTLSCNRSKFKLNTLGANEYPEFPHVEPDSSVTLPSQLLSSMASKVYRAISKDNSRPILQGIMVETKGKQIELVATDSYRLSVCQSEVPEGDGEFRAIIPGSALHDAMGMPTMTEMVSIGMNDNQIAISFGDTTYVTRRLDGNFPDYSRLLPASHGTEVYVDVSSMTAALKRVSVVAQSNPTVRLDIDTESNALHLFASAQDQGESLEEIDCDAQGKSMSIGLNHKFLSDVLDGADGTESLVIETIGEMQPAVFKSMGAIVYTSLLMPVRL